MPTLASRVTELERLADRRAAAGGDRVSDMMRLARARSRQGEGAPTVLHDVAALEVAARLPGLRGEMGRAAIRMIRGFAPEAPQTVRVSAENGRGEVGSMETPASVLRGSTAAPGAATAVSETVRRIDQLLHRPTPMAEPLPPPPAANREELVVREVELIQDELRRVDARLRALAWNAGPLMLRPAETWAEVALGVAPDHQADGDEIARRCLQGKRDALLHRLSELRARLTGQAGALRRGGWG